MSALTLIGAVFGAAEAALELLGEREKNYPQKQRAAFTQRLSRIKKEWYAEYNRDPATRSDAVLDKLQFELCQYLSDFATIVGTKNIPHQ
jgi:hypothetical protein